MSDYNIQDGVLSVQKDLRQDFDLSFDQACSDLLGQQDNTLVIDLGDVTFINSTYIGMIAATYFQAQSTGKDLSIKAKPQVLNILRAAGFEGFINLVEA